MLVEGAGGLLVPLTKDYFISDLAADLGLPLVIVADVGLGAINHTLLTIEHAKNKGLKIAGLIFNTRGPRPGVVESTNPGIIKSISNIPVLGVVPHNNFRNIKIMLDGIINA